MAASSWTRRLLVGQTSTQARRVWPGCASIRPRMTMSATMQTRPHSSSSSSSSSSPPPPLPSIHPQGFTPPSADELQELRERVQDFARREIPESVAAQTDKSNAFPAHMWEKLGEAGLLGVTADESAGGLGMGYQAHAVVMEELSRASGSVGLSYAAHSQLCVNQLQLHGTAAQKAQHLPGLVAGRR
ncbi:hypothetical protein E4U54_002506, partial [Claviceps lovelessii]